MSKKPSYSWGAYLLISALVLLGIFFLKWSPVPTSLDAHWGEYASETDLPGFLYTYTVDDKILLLSSDSLLDERDLPTKQGNLSLAASSPFFNPNACSKMPNVFLNESIIFRDYLYMPESDTTTDVFYRFNTKTFELSQFSPSVKVIGDGYVHGDVFYFFFLDEKKNMYRASSRDTLDTFEVEFVSSEFKAGEIQFFAGESAFIYSPGGAATIKYAYSYEKGVFEKMPQYKKTSRLTTEGASLIYHFPATPFVFEDRKEFNSRTQKLSRDNHISFEYTGLANLYPIGFAE